MEGFGFLLSIKRYEFIKDLSGILSRRRGKPVPVRLRAAVPLIVPQGSSPPFADYIYNIDQHSGKNVHNV
jgi:hypothetical protein